MSVTEKLVNKTLYDSLAEEIRNDEFDITEWNQGNDLRRENALRGIHEMAVNDANFKANYADNLAKEREELIIYIRLDRYIHKFFFDNPIPYSTVTFLLKFLANYRETVIISDNNEKNRILQSLDAAILALQSSKNDCIHAFQELVAVIDKRDKHMFEELFTALLV